MHNTTNTLNGIIATANRLGATIPKPTATEWQKLTSLQEKVNALDVSHDLVPAILSALEKDKDPATDPTVLKAVTARAIGDVRRPLEAALDDRVREFAGANGPEILVAFKKPFDNAAATIARCLDSLGDVALDDTKAAISQGGNSAQIWGDAKLACRVIEDIRTAWKLLRTVAKVGPNNPRHGLLVIADIPVATFIDEQLGLTPTMSAWDVARRGWPLSLATADTIAERVDAIAAEQQRRATLSEGAFEREYRRKYSSAAT